MVVLASDELEFVYVGAQFGKRGAQRAEAVEFLDRKVVAGGFFEGSWSCSLFRYNEVYSSLPSEVYRVVQNNFSVVQKDLSAGAIKVPMTTEVRAPLRPLAQPD